MHGVEGRASLLLALGAVVRTPRAISRQLQSLLSAWPPGARARNATDARATVLAAHAALRRLARLRTGYWRSTCLYLSVAECLVLRELGFPARVVIGARFTTAKGTVTAHAWVECEGIECVSQPASDPFEILTGSAIAGLA